LTINFLKKKIIQKTIHESDVSIVVKDILDHISSGGDQALLEFAKKFDNWEGKIEVSSDIIQNADNLVKKNIKDDILYAYRNIKVFAERQLESITEFDLEVAPGLNAGQKIIPLETAGCYVPGGRYSHIASALMTVTTAKAAGVKNIIACTPPNSNVIGAEPISNEMLYTLNLCGADKIFLVGGVQAIALMANGLLGTQKADIIVGPGNQYVAEAKRQIFGATGIDLLAGPTDVLIIADEEADAELVATDLVSQAEHGYNSPVWLVTTSNILAKKVLQLVPEIIEKLPAQNKLNASQAWRELGEIILCSTRAEAVKIANEIAPEHLHVQATEPDWWKGELNSYGSLFLGEETTVAFGDKAAGPNHVLPTSGAAKYTGGLSVHKFIKVVTWQKAESRSLNRLAEVTANISRLEGMEGHALSADARLKKYRK
jgi:sulfopropanediol 3-dehydrogenase